MKCFQCGQSLPGDTRYCSRCGAYQGFSPELLEKARNGEESALTELYQRTYNSVYYTVKALISSEDTALDIVQDTYVKAFRSLHQLKEPEKFRAWMKVIARNKAVDYLRKTKPAVFSDLSSREDMVEFEDQRPEHLPEMVIDRQETQRLIREILDSLTPEQRLAVGLYYYENLSVKEIAATLGVGENTVKSRLAYGRKKIETRVRELEKQGTRLYGLSPIPFLLLLFWNQDLQSVVVPPLSPGKPQVRHTPGKGAAAAGKGLGLKIAAAVLAAGVTGGAILLSQKDSPSLPESTQASTTIPEATTAPEAATEPSQTEPPSTEPARPSEEDLYQPVLEEYAVALGQPAGEDFYVNSLLLYLSTQAPDYYKDFYYALHDLDGNGVRELLIGVSTPEGYVLGDVFALEGETPFPLFPEESLGERTRLFILPEGQMYLLDFVSYNQYAARKCLFRDNTLTQEEAQFLEGTYDFDALLAQVSGGMAPLRDFDGKPIRPRVDLTRYVGTYRNGNDWNAGTLTLSSGEDKEVLSVTLEAFPTRSAQELSRIFEGTARWENGALVITVEGQTAARLLPGTYGWYLEPEPDFRQAWNLDEYVYTAEYVSTQ